MLNSCDRQQQPLTASISETNLLNSHHNLNGIQAVQTEVIGEVGGRVDLLVTSQRNSPHVSTVLTLLGSETCNGWLATVSDSILTRFHSTNLVEVLQQVHYPTLDFILVKTGRGGIESSGLVRESGSDLGGTSNGRAADLERSRRPDSTRHGGSQRADNGGTEHGDSK